MININIWCFEIIHTLEQKTSIERLISTYGVLKFKILSQDRKETIRLISTYGVLK